MKIKGVLLWTFSLIALQGHAQKKDKEAPAAEHEVNIYNSAMLYGDYEAAKNAMYGLIEKHPENNSYLDSLTRLYFAIGANNQTVMAGNNFLKRDTNDTVLELVAIANYNLKRNKESLDLYKQLQGRTKSPYFAYQVAYNEYELQTYEACNKTLDAIIKDTATDSRQININIGQNKSQRIPLKAAAYNLLGVVQLELKQNDKAKNNFESALKIYPDFQLAKENMEFAGKPKEDTNPTPANKKQ